MKAKLTIVKKEVKELSGKSYDRINFTLKGEKGEFQAVAFGKPDNFKQYEEGKEYELELVKEKDFNGNDQWKVQRPARQGGGGSGYRKGGGGGYRQDPVLEMVKNAAVQASQVIIAQVNNHKGLQDDKYNPEEYVQKYVGLFFQAQHGLYEKHKPKFNQSEKKEEEQKAPEQPQKFPQAASTPGKEPSFSSNIPDQKPEVEPMDDLPF